MQLAVELKDYTYAQYDIDGQNMIIHTGEIVNTNHGYYKDYKAYLVAMLCYGKDMTFVKIRKKRIKYTKRLSVGFVLFL